MRSLFVAVLVLSLIVIDMAISTLFILPFAFLKLVFIKNFRFWNAPIVFLAEQWIKRNNLWFSVFLPTKFVILGDLDFAKSGNYLLVANHQSWVDILAMQHVGNKYNLPLMRFFIKKELLYVPIAGVAWWALDFPRLNRFSKEYLEKYPQKRGEDIKAMISACKKFTDIPSTVTVYPEGTRLTPEKHKKQQSPYMHLLKAKSGGLATAVTVLEKRFSTLVDLTIYYPNGIPGFLAFVSGKVKEIHIHVSKRQIPENFYGKNYFEDDAYKEQFSDWLNNIWKEKDLLLEQMSEKNT